MRIALFGATGKTGSEFLKVALENEHSIRALVRTPTKLTVPSEKLEIIQGDVLNYNDVEDTVEKADVVVSLFGHVKGSPAHLQTKGTENIIKAMKKHQVKRIISLSGGGLPYEKDQPKFPDKMIRFIMKVAVPKVLNDAIDHAEVLKKSETEWTIVRGPRLTEEPRKGHYREGWVGVNASTKVGRADLADFIMKEVENPAYKHQMPFISY